MSDGFVSRWSRKKQLDQRLKEQSRTVADSNSSSLVPQTGMRRSDSSSENAWATRAELSSQGNHLADDTLPLEKDPHSAQESVEPEGDRQNSVPGLAEAKELPVGSEIKRFMRPDVSEEARREALQKLFADPLYNVISDMDDYVEDYSNLPNLSKDELRKLNHIKGLYLFEDPPWKKEEEARKRRSMDAISSRSIDSGSESTFHHDPPRENRGDIDSEQAVPLSHEDNQSQPGLGGDSLTMSPVEPLVLPDPIKESYFVSVSPPPPHQSRSRPVSVKLKDDGYQPLDDADVKPVSLAGRPYQPTKRKESGSV